MMSSELDDQEEWVSLDQLLLCLKAHRALLPEPNFISLCLPPSNLPLVPGEIFDSEEDIERSEFDRARQKLFTDMQYGNIRVRAYPYRIIRDGRAPKLIQLSEDAIPLTPFNFIRADFAEDNSVVSACLEDPSILDQWHTGEETEDVTNRIGLSRFELYLPDVLKYVDVEFYSPEVRSNPEVPSEYIPPYIDFMLRVVRELELSPEHRMPKKLIEDWIKKKWPPELGNNSQRKRELMATFLRHPDDEKGGNTGYKNSDD
jgi:hypothetical protein